MPALMRTRSERPASGCALALRRWKRCKIRESKKTEISDAKNREFRSRCITAIIFAAFFTASCGSGQRGAERDESLTAIEFRVAAEGRLSWRDPGLAAGAFEENWVKAKILGFNDFHGNLNGRSITGRPVGGAAVLAAYLKAESSEVGGRAVIVHAGDLVGASPPESGLLQDEPTVQFLNLLANDKCSTGNLMAPACNMVGTLGNHEFDDGRDELLRLLYGGRQGNADSMSSGWAGAEYPNVSANVLDAATGKTLLPPYVIKEIGGVPVAFIGAVLKNTPRIVNPAGSVGLEFLDEASAINSYVPELKARNVRAIIVTIHQGLTQTSFAPDVIVGEGGLQGNIINIVRALDDEIDIVVSGHAHHYTNVLVPNSNGKEILLTQAFSSGTAYGDIDITLDPKTGDMIEKSASIATTWADQGPGLSPDPEIARFVEAANIAVQPLVSRIIGVAATDILRTQNSAGESPLGNLIADSQRAAMAVDFAFTGSEEGSIREELDAGDILWGELYAMKPFGGDIIALTLTEQQIVRLLNQAWVGRKSGYISQVSGLSYTWDADRPEGDKIVEIRDAAGRPLEAGTSYRVAVNSYYASGGDGFSVLTEGSNRIVGPAVLDSLVNHIKSLPQPVEARFEGRICRLN